MVFDQADNEKKKVQIRRAPQNRFFNSSPNVRNTSSSGATSTNSSSPIENEVKNLKKMVSRLSSFAQYEENVLNTYKDRIIYIRCIDGSRISGVLKNITKYQVIIEESGTEKYIYKSAIIAYSFGPITGNSTS